MWMEQYFLTFLITKTFSDQFVVLQRFCKNVFILWYSYITNFKFIVICYTKVNIFALIYLSRLHFDCSIISIILFVKYINYFINIYILWYWSHIFVDFTHIKFERIMWSNPGYWKKKNERNQCIFYRKKKYGKFLKKNYGKQKSVKKFIETKIS